MQKRTAVVVDAQPLWIDAIEQVLRGIGIKIIGKGTTDRAVSLVEGYRPELLILGSDGSISEDFRKLENIHKSCPELTTIVVSGKSDSDTVSSAFAAGANIFCARAAEREDFAAAVRLAMSESIFVSVNFRSQTQINTGVYPASPDLINSLTRREREILCLVAEGYSNSRLAKMLWVTEQTVKFHLSNVYRKLNVSNRTEAARWAQLHGILPDDYAASSLVRQ